MRKIKLRVLVLQGIVYRVFIIACNIVFFLVITGKFNFAIKISLLWSIVNLTIYYIYHYVFLKLFKMGVD